MPVGARRIDCHHPSVRARWVSGYSGNGPLSFDAAINLATSAFTPLIDRAALLLRHSGVREADAPRLAVALFQKTAADYLHSGKQSWGWYMQAPEAAGIEAQIASAGVTAGESLAAVLRQLVLLGFEVFEKHQDVAQALSPPRP
jgi:hypothetical protein